LLYHDHEINLQVLKSKCYYAQLNDIEETSFNKLKEFI
jgi:hypothetical protein